MKRIRDALVLSMSPPFEPPASDMKVFIPPGEDALEVAFAERFSEAGGRFVFCANTRELTGNLLALIREKKPEQVFCAEKDLSILLKEKGVQVLDQAGEMEHCPISITACECLVARTGSVVMSSRLAGGRSAFSLPPVHVVLAATSQIVPDIGEALSAMKRKYADNWPGMLSFVTGPSRTADIEKKLVHGAHGPKEVYLFMLDAVQEE